MAKLKSDDDVIVIAGKDKGKRGTVRRLLDSDRVIVSGVNMVKKHTKPNPQAGVAGGIVEQSARAQQKYFVNICVHEAVGLPKPVKRLDEEGNEVDGVPARASISLGGRREAHRCP